MPRQGDVENSEVPLNPRDGHWKRIFDKYDRDRDGFINLGELKELIDSREYEHDIPDHVVTRVYEMADRNNDGKIDLDEFISMIHHPDNTQLFGHYLNRYIHALVPRRIDKSRTEPDAQYEDEYSCCPPAVGMIIISLVEIVFFCIDESVSRDSTLSATGPMAKIFIYDPHKRYQAWRYLTYMFVHIGYFHLIVNLLVQILLGTPLEMVHRWWRVLIIYFAGVVAGSLGTSITDPTVKLAGASGGVYSLITAHVATICMNWKEMTYPIIQLMIFLIIAITDISQAVYNRFVLELDEHIGYSAHLAGAIAGLLVGLNILRNLEVTRTEKIVWWCSMIAYVTLMTIAILWNACWKSYFPPQFH